MKYLSEPAPPARRTIPEWTLEASAETPATPDDVWALWSDLSAWPVWNRELESCRLDGPFAPGTRGARKPKDGPAVAIELTEVFRGRGFTERSRLPFTSIELSYRLDPQPHGWVRITHRVRIRGLLTPILRRTLSRKLEGDLCCAVHRLAVLAADRHAAALVAV